MTIHINLLPWREELKETRKKEFLVLLVSTVLAMALLLVLMHLCIESLIQFQIEDNDRLRQEIISLEQNIDEIKKLKDEKVKLLNRMQVIQEFQMNRTQIIRLFDGIVRTVPDGLFITHLSRVGNKIYIDGKTESNHRVSTFMRNIENYDWLKQPKLTLIQAEEREKSDQYIDFNMEVEEIIKEQVEAHESKS